MLICLTRVLGVPHCFNSQSNMSSKVPPSKSAGILRFDVVCHYQNYINIHSNRFLLMLAYKKEYPLKISKINFITKNSYESQCTTKNVLRLLCFVNSNQHQLHAQYILPYNSLTFQNSSFLTIKMRLTCRIAALVCS